MEGDRTRTMMGGYKLLHAGGDGRSNGVGGHHCIRRDQ